MCRHTRNCECKQFSTACQQHFYWNYLGITIKDDFMPLAVCVFRYMSAVYIYSKFWVSIYKLQRRANDRQPIFIFHSFAFDRDARKHKTCGTAPYITSICVFRSINSIRSSAQYTHEEQHRRFPIAHKFWNVWLAHGNVYYIWRWIFITNKIECSEKKLLTNNRKHSKNEICCCCYCWDL